jgi:hypothetical protein
LKDGSFSFLWQRHIPVAAPVAALLLFRVLLQKKNSKRLPLLRGIVGM